MKTIIMTDSTCDIDPKEYAGLGIEVVPLTVMFGTQRYRDGVDITKEEFFKMLETDEDFPTTSQPSPEQFYNMFMPHCQNGDEIIYIGVSSGVSGTVQSARIAKDMCDYDNLYIVDSYVVTAPLELLVRYACQLRQEGKTAKEIVESVELKKDKVRLYAVVDTMKYLVKGGRVPKTAGALGGALGVKPMVTLKNGGVHACDYARGKQRSFEKIFKYFNSDDVDTTMPIAMVNSNDHLKMAELELYFYSQGVKYEWFRTSIGSVIGTHAGPGAVGVAYFVK